MKISKGIKDICKQMIENPNDWYQGTYSFTNRTHQDISFWTANGLFFIQLNGNASLNISEKILVSKSIKQSIANRLKST